MPTSALIAVKTVLVADDTAFVRDRFRTALDGAGHRAIAVRTGSELLATLQRSRAEVDLVILDLRLPDSRGVELLRSIRKLGEPQPRIVVFSGTIASADEVRDLGELGVAGYVNEYTAVQHIVPTLGPHLFPDNYNRRSSPRVTVGTPISYRVGNQISAALTINVSRGGVAIRTTSPLAVNTAFKLRFRLPGGTKDIEADARVAWMDRRIGMGAQFTRIDPADDAAIARFADSHFFSNRKA